MIVCYCTWLSGNLLLKHVNMSHKTQNKPLGVVCMIPHCMIALVSTLMFKVCCIASAYAFCYFAEVNRGCLMGPREWLCSLTTYSPSTIIKTFKRSQLEREKVTGEEHVIIVRIRLHRESLWMTKECTRVRFPAPSWDGGLTRTCWNRIRIRQGSAAVLFWYRPWFISHRPQCRDCESTETDDL